MQQDSKMRIKLYNADGLYSDRLTEQLTELRIGPKFKHEGPITIEVNLSDKEEAEKVIQYIKLLTGFLPIENKSKKVKLSQGTIELDNSEPLEDLMNAALQSSEYQESLIIFLRKQGFQFIDSSVITELVPELKSKLELKPLHEGYQFMVRMVKEAKDPRKDKWDYRLLFGIKIVGDKTSKVVVYLFGKFNTKKLIPWKKANKVNFKKVDRVMVFPDHMDYDDRKKWRVEHVRIINSIMQGKPLTPTKFYSKNSKFVMINGVAGNDFYDTFKSEYTTLIANAPNGPKD